MSPEFNAIVEQQIATSNEMAELLQDKIAKSTDGTVVITSTVAQCLASVLRIEANLIKGFLQEHDQLMTRIAELIERLPKES